MAAQRPEQVAVVQPFRRRRGYKYRTWTFAQLHHESNLLALGLSVWGVQPGTRLALLVRPSCEFIALVFALLKCGATTILIDPGLGRKHLLRCLSEAQPEGFVGGPLVQTARWLLRRRFPQARFNVTVGRRFLGPGLALEQLRALGQAQEGVRSPFAATTADSPAAIIFTTGSTGPPKGVLYTQGIFDKQVEEIRDAYGIQPGEIDLPGFPLFGLFNAAMGVTTVIPDMDPTRPARVRPARLTRIMRDWQVTQSFGSPAIWQRVGPWCQARQVRLASLRRVLSAGAPVPPRVLETLRACLSPEGEIHTPYGATEALPVATISAQEILGETQYRSRVGAGTCVGRRFPAIQWRVIQITEGPLPRLADAVSLPLGEVGELIVSGPVVTQTYVTRSEHNALAKIADGDRFWHRMGDAGYLDEKDRFWFCGRVAHRVYATAGPLESVCCEAVFDEHPSVYRSALVGVGPRGTQRPVVVVEPWPQARPKTARAQRQLLEELRQIAVQHPHTATIVDFLIHPSLPVDIRHNAKIFRERLAVWAEGELH